MSTGRLLIFIGVACALKPHAISRSCALRVLGGGAVLATRSCAARAGTGFDRQVQETTPSDTPLSDMLPKYQSSTGTATSAKFWDIGQPPVPPPPKARVTPSSAGGAADAELSPFQKLAQANIQKKAASKQ